MFPIMRLHIVSGDTPNNAIELHENEFPIMRLHIVSGDVKGDSVPRSTWVVSNYAPPHC